MKYSEKLETRYREEIASADWPALIREAEQNPQWDEFGDAIVGQVLLGSITSLFPSGKIWTFWTSNQTVRDVVRDQAYRDALESVVNDHGMFISEFSGDLFACIMLDDGYEAIVWHDRDRNHSVSGFYQGRDVVARTGLELESHMRADGLFPGIYLESGCGDLSYFEDWQDADGYDQDDEDYPIEDNATMVAYVVCMLWSSVNDNDTPLDSIADIDALDANARAKVYQDCAEFLMNPKAREALDSGAWSAEQLGHDFWLTRNGHGVGFWDRGKGDLGDALTEIAARYGEQNPWVYKDEWGCVLIGLE